MALSPLAAGGGTVAFQTLLSHAGMGARRAGWALLLAAGVLAAAIAPATAAEGGPAWTELQSEHQKILAPLKVDWPNIEPERKLKWVEIAKRYPTMTAQQQQRLQDRMKSWAALSHEERTEVRKRYKVLRSLPPEKQREIQRKWEEYDSLPEEEKASLRQAHPAPATKPKPAN